MSDMKQIIEESFAQYAGAVLQSRALVDVRDCLKPSARQIFYCLYTDKFLPNKPFKKTLKAIGSVARMYIHGDSSAEGIIMRAGQEFAMRYPLIEVEGNNGSLIQSGNWAAPRYSASRLSEFNVRLFEDINKDTIEEWRDNYDDTEKYPSVLPSKGYYNIVNGSMGIGLGAASSIPQFNIKDVNEALCKLLLNPNIDDDEIICMPDFATGAILLNANAVRESLKKGRGKSCILRSVVEYDDKERCLIVKELPYSVYTNTICGQLEAIVNEGNSGIETFNDLTGKTPLIKIYLSKGASPDKVLKRLYKDTSLQYYFGINMTMLDNGRFPRVFTWKEALQAHIDHEKIVYRRGFEFDLKKIEARLHIIAGLFICLANIDEVVQTIKQSSSIAMAAASLMDKFLLDNVQVKAVLDMKLSRLAHLEVKKLQEEEENLLAKKDGLLNILNNEDIFNECLMRGWKECSNKFGDARRTQIMNLDISAEDDTPIEEKTIIVNLTNKGNLIASESTTLITQRRGGKGIKVKLPKDEFIIKSINESNCNNLLLFSNSGKVYSTLLDNITLNTLVYPQSLFNMGVDEQICNMCSFDKTEQNEFIIFTTKSGLVKKSKLSEYKIKKGKGVAAIKLKDGDEIVDVSFAKNETLGILTKLGYFVKIDIEKINPIGRLSMGVQGIKLNADDEVVSARIIGAAATDVFTISAGGLGKITNITEYPICNRATKGSLAQKLKENDTMAAFIPINDEVKEMIVVSTSGPIKILISQIQKSSRASIGTTIKKLGATEKIKSVAINF